MSSCSDHRKIIEDCLSKIPLRVTPVALWRHFPADDMEVSEFVTSVENFQRQFDFDILKITPASSYSTYDWGTKDEWQGNPEGSRENRIPVIHEPSDWLKLRKLDVRHGSLGKQVQAVRMLRNKFNKRTPLIETVFSPLSQAKHLAGNETLLSHVKNHAGELMVGLQTISDTTIDFLEACQKENIDGFFYAVQHAQDGQLSEGDYQKFGLCFDEKILAAMNNAWLNILHIHGTNIYFQLLSTLAFQVINWHDQHTKPSLKEARQTTQVTFCGGIRQWESLVYGTPQRIRAECKKAIKDMGNTGFILGTGCVTPLTAPRGNIQAAIDTAREFK